MAASNVIFTVKEGETDAYVAVEYHGKIVGADQAEIYIRLPPGADSLEDARKVANFLSENVRDITFGRLVP